MSKSAVVAKNTFFLLLDRGMRGLLLMALTVWLARALGVQAFGVYALAVTLGGIFRVLTDFGIAFKSSYEVTRAPHASSAIFTQGMVLKALTALAGIGLLIGGTVLFYPSRLHVAIWMGTAAAVCMGFIEFANAVFGGQERMEYISMSMVFYMTLVFVLVGGLLITGSRSVPWLLGVQVLAGIGGWCFTGWLLATRFRIRWVPINSADLWRLLVQSVPFGMYFISDIIYFHTDIVLLSLLRGESAVGLYQSAFKVIQLTESLPLLFMSAMFPTVTRTYVRSPEETAAMLAKSLRYLLLLGLPLAIGTMLVGHEVIRLLYGQEFSPAGNVLQLLAIMIPFRYATFLYGMALTATGHQQGRMTMVGVTAVLNILLNLWWIPYWGMLGSAAASVFSAIVLAGALGYSLHATLPLRHLVSVLWRPLLAAAGMGSVVFLLKGWMPVLGVIGIGAATYAGMLVLVGGVRREDGSVLRGLMRREKARADITVFERVDGQP